MTERLPANWTATQMVDLKRLWLRGDTASKIGRAIDKTKGSVVGMARRQGLPSRPSPIKRMAKSTPKRMAKSTPKKPLVEVRSRGACLFPLWPDNSAPTDQFCDTQPQAGSVYCPEHHKKCYTTAQGWGYKTSRKSVAV